MTVASLRFRISVMLFALFIVLCCGRIKAQSNLEREWTLMEASQPYYVKGKSFAYNGRIYMIPDLSSLSEVDESGQFIEFIHVLENPDTFDWGRIFITGEKPKRSDNYHMVLIGDELYILDQDRMSLPIHVINMKSYVVRFLAQPADAPLVTPTSYVFSYNDQVHIFAPYVLKFSGDIAVMNKESNSWNMLPTSTPCPLSYYGSMGLYQNRLLYIPQCSFFCEQTMWIYDFESYGWIETGMQKEFASAYFSKTILANLVVGNKWLIFGTDYGFFPRPINFMTHYIVLDLSTMTLEVNKDLSTKKNLKGWRPYPPQQMGSVLIYLDGYAWMLNGQSACQDTTTWKFLPNETRWVSSFDIKPSFSGRELMAANSTHIFVYGGLNCLSPLAYKNSLWTLDTTRQLWTMLAADTVTINGVPPPAPPLYQDASINVRNEFLYLIGAALMDGTSRLGLFRFHLSKLRWEELALVNTLTSKEYEQQGLSWWIGDKIYSWMGFWRHYGFPLEEGVSIIVTDITQRIRYKLPPPDYAPPPRVSTSLFSDKDSLCFYGGTYYYETFGEIWCYKLSDNRWEIYTDEGSQCPSLTGHHVAFQSYLFVYSGKKQSAITSKAFYLFDLETKYCRQVYQPGRKPISLSSLSAFVDNTWFYISGYQFDVVMEQRIGAVYSLKLAFCPDHTVIDASLVGDLDDGSEELRALPGTECSWTIKNVDILEVAYIHVQFESILSIRVDQDCSRGSSNLLRDAQLNEIRITSQDKGRVIHFYNSTIVVTYKVPLTTTTDGGFRFRFHGCPYGFSFEGGCICPENHEITFLGQCLPQAKFSDKGDDVPLVTKSEKSIAGQVMVQLESLQPAYLGCVVVVDDTVFAFGGLMSKPALLKSFLPLDIVYESSRPDRHLWEVVSANGTVPSGRYGACAVAFGQYIFMDGGVLEDNTDTYLYRYDVKSKQWSRMISSPLRYSGMSCVAQGSSILFVGGSIDGVSWNRKTWKYTINGNSVSLTSFDKAPSVSFAPSVIYASNWYIYEGQPTHEQDPLLWRYNTGVWEKIPLSAGDCAPCSVKPVLCGERMMSAYGAYESFLYIIGGFQQEEQLNDMLVIDIEARSLLRSVPLEDTGVISTAISKSGMISCVWANSMVILGGFEGTTDCLTDTTWIFDMESRLWRSGAGSAAPEFRNSAQLVSFDESVFLHGGRKCDGNWVDDRSLWRLEERENNTLGWTLFSKPLLSTMAPATFGHALVVYESSIYIFGGANQIGSPAVWSIDAVSGDATILDMTSDTSPSQRLLGRSRFAFCQNGSVVWVWGGEYVQKEKEELEDYSTVFVVDLSRQHIQGIRTPNSPGTIIGATAVVHTSSLYIYGGVNILEVSNEFIYVYGTETYSWKYIRPSSLINTPQAYAITGFLEGFLLAAQSYVSTNTSYFSFLDIESMSVIPLHGAPKHGTVLHNPILLKDRHLFVGGSMDSSHWMGVFSYVPDSTPSYLSITPSSDGSIRSFDDGSGASRYFSGVSGTWVLKESNFLWIEYDLLHPDKVTIVVDGISKQGISHTFFGKGKSEVIKSNSGFTVLFESQAEIEISKRGQGFIIYHADCGQIPLLDPTKGCVCSPGFIIDRQKLDCRPCDPSRDDDCQSSKDGSNGDTRMLVSVLVSVPLFVVSVSLVFIILKYRRMGFLFLGLKSSKTSFSLDASELLLEEKIGQSRIGEVWVATWRGMKVSVKRLDEDHVRLVEKGDVERLCNLIACARHPNILLHMGIAKAGESILVVSEYMSQRSLYEMMQGQTDIPIRWKLRFVSDIIKGMYYLHASSPVVIHGHLKSSNVLVDAEWNAKIGDNIYHTNHIKSLDPFNKGIHWLAPEIITAMKYTTQSDVYSFAIVCWEIFTQQEVYADVVNKFELLIDITQGRRRPHLPEDIPFQFRDLMERCWHQIPSKRPSFKSIWEEFRLILSDQFIDFFGDEQDYKDLKDALSEGTIVAISVDDVQYLWEEAPSATEASLSFISALVKKIVKKRSGKKLYSSGDAFLLLFMDPKMAIMASLEIQEECHTHRFPDEIESASKSHESESLKGVLLKINISKSAIGADYPSGYVRRFDNKDWQKYLDQCQDILGGQIIVSSDLYQIIRDYGPYLGGPVCNLVREPGLSDSEASLYAIYPRVLSERANILQRATSTRAKQPQVHVKDAQTKYVEQSVTPETSKAVTSTNPAFNHGYLQRKTRYHGKLEVDYASLSVGGEKLGAGSYGIVQTGLLHGQKVAVKRLINQTTDDYYYLAFMAEGSIMRKLEHPNLVKLLGMSTKHPNLAIVMEYMENGTLAELIAKSPQLITRTTRQRIIVGVVQAMEYLHTRSPPILHRDLKPSNIMLDSSLEPKIGDFGFAKTKSRNLLLTGCGTLAYQAPEILMGKGYDEKVDVYSFSIILWQLAFLKNPYGDMKTPAITEFVKNGGRPSVQRKVGSSFILRLAIEGWSQDPKVRPGFSEIQGKLSSRPEEQPDA